MATVKGTNRNDTLIGTNEADVIRALGGDDRLMGGGGDDILYGGDGNDVITDTSGSDTIDAGAGDDRFASSRVGAPMPETVTVAMGDGADDVRYGNRAGGSVTVDAETVAPPAAG